MIRLGLRLTLHGGREAVARLAVICAAVAIGVGLLLSTLAGLNAVHHQNDRYAWLETSAESVRNRQPVAGVDPVWWMLSADELYGQQIGRVDVAQTGSSPPVPPGLSRLPAPGEYFASPALVHSLETLPDSQLAARYPGHLAGRIGDAGLPSPDSLIVVVGRTVNALSGNQHAALVSAISTTPPNKCDGACYDIGLNSRSIDLILGVVTAAILFPVLIFIGTATRLSAARREQRFAALRLVGATPRQIAVISTAESTLATTVGTAIGFAIFALIRPLMAAVPFTGSKFFADDLTLSGVDVVAVAVGVPVAAAIAARLALRRVIISPLGVTRRVTPKAPSAARLLVPLLGIGELTYFAVAGRPATTGGQTVAFTFGVIVTLVGLVLAGPWLTMVGSGLLARRANRPAPLLAARRLGDNPHGGFRAISGLVVGLYVATVAAAIIISMGLGRGSAEANTASGRATIVADLTVFSDNGPTAPVQGASTAVTDALTHTAGVKGVVALHAATNFASTYGPPVTIADCASLRTTAVLGSCAPGAVTAEVDDPSFNARWRSNQHRIWPASTYSLAALNKLPVATIVVSTDGARAALENARTILENGLPDSFLGSYPPLTVAENQALSADARRAAGYQRLADVVILTSLPIAGCTLAVSVVSGLNDRRRAFSLLRLAGTPLAALRRVIIYEAAVPLLVSALVSIGVGFLTAFLFLQAQLGEALSAPGAGYYASVIGGVLASLAIIASTFPVLRRLTGPEAARND
jgi:hypothetical protein